MQSRFTSVRCLVCNQAMPADLHLPACTSCGSAWLDARYDCAGLPRNWPDLLAGRETNMWRYRELLPFDDAFEILSLGEGWTPLLRAGRLADELGLRELYIKDERQEPTGSFKDRQAAASVSALAARGVTELALSSTGNAAAAYAAFCARAGIKLWVFLTSSVPAEKMRELALYGAEVIKINGTYDQAKRIAADFARRRGIHYDLGAKSIPGKESMKTIAFEIVEQMGWRAPDWYVQAVSGGIGPLGVLKGFRELYEAGLIDRVPKIGVVQSAGCAPMVQAWERGDAKAQPVEPDTLITVLATGDPGLAYEILKRAGDENGGAMVSVTDGEAFRTMRRVARAEGLSVEPAVAVAFAGLAKMLEAGHIEADETVVINCSGHTFSAEKHALEDRYVVDMRSGAPAADLTSHTKVGRALEQLEEQVTSIAVIDDNPHDSRLIRRLLQRHRQYRVFESHSGVDGIDLVRQRRPDLVVLDLMMPQMDGFSVMEVLKADANTRDIPVVVISAKSLEPFEREHLARHADSVWRKGDFRADELVSHVVTLLGGDDETTGILSDTGFLAEADEGVTNFGQEARRRILLVDPSPLDARLLRRVFEAGGRFEVAEAPNAREALKIAREFIPDLVMLDPALPEMDGETLVQRLRAEPVSHLGPIIVVSRQQLEGHQRARLARQVDSIWSKETLDRNSLLEHVQALMLE